MKLRDREPSDWADLVRSLDDYQGSKLDIDVTEYLEARRDEETGWLVNPTPKDAGKPVDEIRGALATRAAYNRAILFAVDLRKKAQAQLDRSRRREES